MIKIRYVLALFIFSAFLYSLFQIKFKVQELHRESAELKRELQHEKDSIHVLKAEWAYLNQPERLYRLSQKFLDLKEVKADQLLPAQAGLMITPTIKLNEMEFADQAIVRISYQTKEKIGTKRPKKKWNYRARPMIHSRPKK